MAILDEGSLVSCDQCSRQYSTHSALFRHQKSHDRNKWYSCNICSLQFSRKDVLRRHKRVHGDSNDPTDRKRAIRACDECRRSKIRCNSHNPCHACLDTGKECTYLMKSSRPSAEGFHGECKPSDTSFTPAIPEAQQPRTTQNESSLQSLPTTSGAFTTLDLVNIDQCLPVTTYADINQTTRGFSEPTTDVDYLLSPPFDISALAYTYSPINPTSDLLLSGVDEFGTKISFCSNTPSPRMPNFYEPYPFTSSMRTIPSTIGSPPHVQSLPVQKAQFPIPKASFDLVYSIVQEASVDFFGVPKKDAVYRSRKRRGFSQLTERNFALAEWMRNKATHVLHSFVTSFFHNFFDFWPIAWRQGFDYDAIEPLLYLAMTSIGAIYSGNSIAAAYGRTLHYALRPVLLNSCLLCPEDEIKSEDIFEALLLTKVMSLHLGHAEASSFSQQASVVLLAHAQRLNLFHEMLGHGFPDLTSEICQELTEERLNEWIRREKRRRMAFGLFRCETIASLLFNEKLLVLPEDLHIRLPCNNERWTYVGPHWREEILAAVQEAAGYPLYSDLLRTLTDGTQNTIGLFNGPAYELVLYGLQIPLWAWQSHRGLGSGLEQNLCVDPWLIFAIFQTSLVGGDIDKSANSRILRYLNEWQAVQPVSEPLSQQHQQGCSLTRLLYHMGSIRINTDLNTLYSITSRDPKFVTQFLKKSTEYLKYWATTDAAKIALHHACQIWSLSEGNWPPSIRNASSGRDPDFDILSTVALHYAALVVRAMTELCPNLDDGVLLPDRYRINAVLSSSNTNPHGGSTLPKAHSKSGSPWLTGTTLVLGRNRPSQIVCL